MPLIPDSDEPGGLLLTDPADRPLARLRRREDHGEQVFARFEPLPGAAADRVAVQAVRDLAGGQITTKDEPVARALVGVGATIVRASTDMLFQFASQPGSLRPDEVAPADGWALIAHDWDDPGLAEALRLAYGPRHPDTAWLIGDRLTRLRELTEGDRGMPLLAAASARLRGPNRRTAGQVVTVGPVAWSDDPWGWVLDVAVTPAAQGRGLGAALLGHSLRGARNAGMTALGLTVTDGNPARRLYERSGFTAYIRTFTLRAPSS